MPAPQNALSAYTQVDVKGSIEEASPHRLIQMLIDGALEKIAIASGFMERGDIAKKGEYISWAISIIDGLRASLDNTLDNEIVNNLHALYEYMIQRLLDANLHNKLELLAEVSDLMREIKAGWDGIAEEATKIEVSRNQE